MKTSRTTISPGGPGPLVKIGITKGGVQQKFPSTSARNISGDTNLISVFSLITLIRRRLRGTAPASPALTAPELTRCLSREEREKNIKPEKCLSSVIRLGCKYTLRLALLENYFTRI
ncbi:hypothetical protein EVAR_67771_1 [Eumeta japonica]|uniref:Uncharacterized protein n=1 Tax=Eumeta variegata TaxID=151549 RepID=A0A4C1ZEF7_EUMVA|nr:hypothetical protein EVAR_67771_1 [Eumeta japonica]